MINNSTLTTDAGAATTRNERRRRARVIVHGTILIVPKKDSCGDRKAPTAQNDKDFKPCHVHGPKSEHSYDECRHNPKNTNKSNKASFYVKKRGHDAHHIDIVVSVKGTSLPVKMTLPFQAMERSTTTSRVATRGPTRIIIFMILQKKGGFSRQSMWVTSPQDRRPLVEQL